MGAEGEAPSVYIYAQNRGSEALSGVTLSVEINGQLVRLPFAQVGVGQTVSHMFTLDASMLDEAGSVTIDHAVSLDGVADVDPSNNRGVSVLTLTPAE